MNRCAQGQPTGGLRPGCSSPTHRHCHPCQVENGDLNWIVPGKLMAFSGPSAQPRHFGGWRTYSERCLRGVGWQRLVPVTSAGSLRLLPPASEPPSA